MWDSINSFFNTYLFWGDLMEDIVYYNALYDLYSSLLTEKQREYFEDYYFHNLSFAEMAENYDVSRNAMFKQVHIVVDKLKEYEDCLHLYQKKQKLMDISKNLDNKCFFFLKKVLFLSIIFIRIGKK